MTRRGSNPPPPGPKPRYPPAGYVPKLEPVIDDNTRAAAVDHTYHWIKIHPGAPLNRKLQLINRPAGVASYGVLTHTGKQFWTHYALLPTFNEAEK